MLLLTGAEAHAECTVYDPSKTKTRLIEQRARGVYELLQTPKDERKKMYNSAWVIDTRSSVEFGDDPYFHLVHAYYFALFDDYGKSLGALERVSIRLAQLDLCEAKTLAYLVTAQRRQIFTDVFGEKPHRKRGGFDFMVKDILTSRWPLRAENYLDALCYVSFMGADLILSNEEKKLCKNMELK